MSDPRLTDEALRLLRALHHAGGTLSVAPLGDLDGLTDELVELRMARLVAVTRSDRGLAFRVTITETGKACYHNNGRISGLQPFKDLALFDAYTAQGGTLTLEEWMSERGLSESRKAALREILGSEREPDPDESFPRLVW
jgi:hypothetical protein